MPEGRRSDATFCSDRCSKAAYNALIAASLLEEKAKRPPCAHCGGPVAPEKPAYAVFCSMACQRQARAARERAERPVQTCPACGTDFCPTRPVQTHCSRACSNEARRLDTPQPCQHCGSVIVKPLPKQKWCGAGCREAAWRKRTGWVRFNAEIKI
jgi:endogenous inhibitor of DNA gyrase (YacG/DUF329 family)